MSGPNLSVGRGEKQSVKRGDGTWAASSGAGAQGGGASPSNPAYTDQVFFVNSNIVQTNVTLPANDNAGVFGPLTISASATVTIPSTTVLTIV